MSSLIPERSDGNSICRMTPRRSLPPVYCPFPGEVANGRVLLVGNMGMYDYRSYVKKVRRDRVSVAIHQG